MMIIIYTLKPLRMANFVGNMPVIACLLLTYIRRFGLNY